MLLAKPQFQSYDYSTSTELARSFIPAHSYGTMLPAMYPGPNAVSPKCMIRNSTGKWTTVHTMQGSGGRESCGFFPVQMVQPSQRSRVMPITSLQPSYTNTHNSTSDEAKLAAAVFVLSQLGFYTPATPYTTPTSAYATATIYASPLPNQYIPQQK